MPTATVRRGVAASDARKRGRPREAPCVNVEHRRDRHIDVVAMEAALLHRKAEHGEFRDGMQHQLAVAVVDAFRQPRGSGCVKGRRLNVFIEVGKLEVRGSSPKQLLVFANELKFAGRRRFTVGEEQAF